jgi:hypothetical protein
VVNLTKNNASMATNKSREREGVNSPEDRKEEAPWVVRPELQQGKVEPSFLKHPILACTSTMEDQTRY